MKKLCVVVIMLMTIAACQSQSTSKSKKVSDDANAHSRNVSGFTGVEVSSAISLYLSQGNEETVAVSTEDESDVEKVITEVKNGVLKIYVESSRWKLWGSGNKKAKAYVTAKQLDFIHSSGASIIHVNNSISSSTLKINVSGASTFKGIVKTDNLDIKASGASSLYINGSAHKSKIEASGASTIKGYDLIIDNCSVEAAGASNIGLTVNGELNAQASGASDIQYKGNPQLKSISATGASSINKKSN